MKMNGVKIAIIGGSGMYQLIEEAKSLIVDTPYGKSPRIDIGEVSGKKVAFLARHARPGSYEVKHEVPPHMINYRANVYALKKLGVGIIIATNACGSMREEFGPGDIVIPDQLIDMTKRRTYTFYDGDVSPKKLMGIAKDEPVVHIDFTNPYCPTLRKILLRAAKMANIHVHGKGCYVCTEGPRFETPAEIRFFSLVGGDLVGMTSSPEAILARELNMCYATVCVVTNYAAGMQIRISQEEVRAVFEKARGKVCDLLKKTIEMIPKDYSCACQHAVS